jgi:AraC family transcriptional regulator of adaptative response/methylated-DNA-[protein]-cysteine methyltransferase
MLRSEPERGGSALTTVLIDTPAGVFIASFSASGLAQLRFPSGRSDIERPGNPVAEPIRSWIARTRDAIASILSGAEPVDVPPLDLAAGTVFQRRVWAALQAIRRGSTKSYAEVAAAVGSPGGTRAVGNACGANPVPLLVPCHRVIASGGKLGGFSGGLDWKKRLLRAEGALPGNAGLGSETRQQELPALVTGD